jgi:glycosyltransferase involved in cell wall biosynthesis
MTSPLPGDPHLAPMRPASDASDAVRAAAGRVMLVSTNADRAGAPLHVRALALGLLERGWTVGVVFGEEGPVEADLRARGVDCHVLPNLRSDMRFWRDRRSVAGLVGLLQAFAPDLVHAHSAKAGMVARLAAARLGVPCVYTVHGWGFGPGRARLQAAVLSVVERALVRLTARYIAVSRADERLGRERLRLPGDAITTVHNGVEDTPHRARPEVSRVIAMVARAHRQKDHATLLRATEGLDCEVWLAGGGTDAEAFRSALEPAGPDPVRRVRWLGARSDIAELLAGASVFVLSSRYEGLPLSIIEAMRAGLPVVASDVGGVGELVRPDANGALFESGDAAALRARLKALLDDPDRRARLGAAARADDEAGYTVEAMMRSTLEVYRGAMRGAAARRRTLNGALEPSASPRS